MVINNPISSHHPSHKRPPHPSAGWSRRNRRRSSGHSPIDPPSPLLEEEDPQETSSIGGGHSSGRTRRAAKAAFFQKLYRKSPSACVRRLLNDQPSVYCKIPEEDLVNHFTATYAEAPLLAPPPPWLVQLPGAHQDDQPLVPGDVLSEAFTPEEVLTQLKRSKRSAPGVDGITYANWRWIDPLGLILTSIFNICRLNTRVPSTWKHATVTLIHKGGDVTSVRNWRPICLQLTLYKLYTALIARRVASWATVTSAFSPAQKGFLTFDGCVEHNFLLRSILTDSRRRKRDLLLAWLDLRDAFGSVSHQLLLLMMSRLGLSGSILNVVEDIYSNSTVAVRTGKDSYTTPIPQRRGVKQGCPLSPILFQHRSRGPPASPYISGRRLCNCRLHLQLIGLC